jgi:hypothetical protein
MERLKEGFEQVALVGLVPLDMGGLVIHTREDRRTMKTLDLRHQTMTVEELLQLASSDSVLIRTSEGQEFFLESADEFDREVAMLGQSEKFMQFLAERAKERGTIPLERLQEELERKGE